MQLFLVCWKRLPRKPSLRKKKRRRRKRKRKKKRKIRRRRRRKRKRKRKKRRRTRTKRRKKRRRRTRRRRTEGLERGYETSFPLEYESQQTPQSGIERTSLQE